MLTRPTPRRGFTLIELLAVVSIIAILTALVTAGVGRIRAVQMSRVSGDTCSKLQKALDQQWQAVLDDAAKSVPAAVVTFADGDQQRAKALWAYACIKREFPQTFAEAAVPTSPDGRQYKELRPRATFAGVANFPGGDGLGLELQAAVLLYLNLSEKASRGMVFQSDDAMNGVQMVITGASGNTYKVYKDAWGSPITFLRFAQNVELARAPYVNSRTQFHDPFDPTGKLSVWPNGQNRGLAQYSLGTTFDNQNKLITVISAGQNKNSLGNANYPFWDPNHPDAGNVFGGDNIVGYRLTRLGSKE